MPTPLQDYQFVKHFTRTTGRLLGSAPDTHLDTLLSGLGALQDELRWFQRKAQERGLSLEVPMQAANKQYTDFMASLAASSYAVQVRAGAALRGSAITKEASSVVVHDSPPGHEISHSKLSCICRHH
jgi:thiaminase